MKNNIKELIEMVKLDKKIIPNFIDVKTVDGKFYWKEIIWACLMKIDTLIVPVFLPDIIIEKAGLFIGDRFTLINENRYEFLISLYLSEKLEAYINRAIDLEEYEVVSNLTKLVSLFDSSDVELD